MFRSIAPFDQPCLIGPKSDSIEFAISIRCGIPRREPLGACLNRESKGSRMTMRRLLSSAMVFTLLMPLGYSSLWKKNAITIDTTSSVSEKRQSLIVLFPGFGGKGIHFEQQGFIDTMREHGVEANKRPGEIVKDSSPCTLNPW